jgi:5'-deoxynucleotidase YfbR-like HD superfamily hydrolase
MCLIHDLAETIVGDITPLEKLTKEEKDKLENVIEFK